MNKPFILSFHNNVSLLEEASDRIVVQSPVVPLSIPQFTLELNELSPGLLTAIKSLTSEGATEEHLSDLVLQSDGLSALTRLYYYLQKFNSLGMICHSVVSEEIPLATRVPLSPKEFWIRDVASERKYVLSRFAYCRKDNEQLVLESPLSHAQIVLLGSQGAALIAELVKPQTIGELCTKIPGISQEAMQLLFSLLFSNEMLGEVKEEGKIEEEENENLVSWEFHDLLFHSRTRIGRSGKPIGKTFRFLDKIQQPPFVKPKVSEDIIELYQPDLQKLKEDDVSFTQILENRQSIRSYDEQPITDKQLGEFLYRSARNKRVVAKDYGECTHRPYASGGGRYELELYPIINTCENIPSGIYHYCPDNHQLSRLTGRNSHVEALLEEAYFATSKSCIPQILIVFAARFQRISWVYETIAYSLIMKDVGSLQQTMYLVATAMNLAPCALGCGNSDLFARAVGTDYYAETSVGEFILGSQPTK
jgi:SagB-type dehydrogenase family enzyme